MTEADSLSWDDLWTMSFSEVCDHMDRKFGRKTRKTTGLTEPSCRLRAALPSATDVGRVPEVYDFVCSIGELIDKLSIENIKCYDGNAKILAERAKNRDDQDHTRISELEWGVRKAGEQRVRLREEINRRLAEALTRGSLSVAPDVRTYTDQMTKVEG